MRTTMQDENKIYLPEHPVWGTALAVLDGEPVWPQLGAADDDDDGDEIDLENPGKGGERRDVLDDEPDEDDETEENPDGDESDTASKKPAAKPEQKARTPEDFEKLEKALAAERALRKKRDATLADIRKKERAAAAAGDDDAAEQARKASEEAAAKYKPVAIRAAAKAALLEANFQNPTDERIKKMIGRMDIDDIDVDEDGDIIGLDAQIEQLTEDFPESFTTPPTTTAPTKVKPPKLTTADKKPAETTYKSTGERIAARVLGGQK